MIRTVLYENEYSIDLILIIINVMATVELVSRIKINLTDNVDKLRF